MRVKQGHTLLQGPAEARRAPRISRWLGRHGLNVPGVTVSVPGNGSPDDAY
jgi:hypothetical protein